MLIFDSCAVLSRCALHARIYFFLSLPFTMDSSRRSIFLLLYNPSFVPPREHIPYTLYRALYIIRGDKKKLFL